MNVKLLRKVEKHILAEPKRLLMSEIDIHGRPGEETGYGGIFGKCGTAACICGWACSLSGLRWNEAYMGKGARLLGVTVEEAYRLFEPGNWPAKFQTGTADDGKLKTAKIAAARIEHFIKTEGRE